MTECRFNIEDVLEIRKSSLTRKIERDFSDRSDTDEAIRLLRRHGKMYLITEIEKIAGFMISGHDECAESNPDDYTPVEVFQARRNVERYDRVLCKLEKLLGRKPSF